MIAKIIILASLLALTAVDGADQVNARTVFAKLQTLVGQWEGKNGGRPRHQSFLPAHGQ